MEIVEIVVPVDEKRNGGYFSIEDDGSSVQRKLVITDDDGNTVVLKNEQIGELYKRIKPALAG